MTPELKTFSKKKTKLFRRKQNKPTDANISEYKTFNNNYNKLIRQAKVNYFCEMLERHKNDLKQSWKILNEAMGRKQKNQTSPRNIIIDGVNVSDQNKIASYFNEYFVNIGSNIAKNIPNTLRTYTDFMPTANTHSMFINPVQTSEIKSIIYKL